MIGEKSHWQDDENRSILDEAATDLRTSRPYVRAWRDMEASVRRGEQPGFTYAQRVGAAVVGALAFGWMVNAMAHSGDRPEPLMPPRYVSVEPSIPPTPTDQPTVIGRGGAF